LVKVDNNPASTGQKIVQLSEYKQMPIHFYIVSLAGFKQGGLEKLFCKEGN
jgi:hypothetical protein